MAEFLGDIAFILEMFAVAAGLILIHLGKENRKLFSLAGWLLLIVGIGGAVCTVYWMFHYFNMGDFDHAYPQMMMSGNPLKA